MSKEIFIEITAINGNRRGITIPDNLISEFVGVDETYKEIEEFIYDDVPESIILKSVRNTNVSKIKVTTTTGKTFDGDEMSQQRMLRAIKGSEITGLTSTVWKLADNTKTSVTLSELKDALSLAMTEQSKIWMA